MLTIFQFFKSGFHYMTAKDGIDCIAQDFDKELINESSNTYDFCKGDINKFILLLRKGVYPYEFMDSWNSFSDRFNIIT